MPITMAGTAEPATSAGFFRARPMLVVPKLRAGVGVAVLVGVVCDSMRQRFIVLF
jgi:hypothetical protein